MTTPVLFRMDKPKDGGQAFALFPTIEGSPGYCTCYQHVGQHSSAAYTLCIGDSRRATPEEYADLLAELVDYGYDDLKIYIRRPPR